MEFQESKPLPTLTPSGFIAVALFSIGVLYGVHVTTNLNFTYALDPSFVEVVILIFAINISLLVFIQLSLAYHTLVIPSYYWGPEGMKGLRFGVSYIFIALAFLAFLQYFPGQADTSQGQLLKHGLYRSLLLAVTFVTLAVHKVDLGSSGVAFALVMTFVGSEFGSHVLYMLVFFALSLHHQLACKDTKYDVYLFGFLMPLGASLPFITFLTDMSQEALCRFMLPLHVWLSAITFPAVYLWFDVAGWLPQGFSGVFSDSNLLSLLHNKFGPTAIPLRIFVPVQIVGFTGITLLASATCGTLKLFDDGDVLFLAVPVIVALVFLFLCRCVQDAMDVSKELI